MAKSEFFAVIEGFAAGVAETVTIPNWRGQLQIRHSGAQVLYVLFDWETGDTEVSATNFHIWLPGNSNYPFVTTHSPRVGPEWRSVRILSAALGTISIVGW